MNTFTTRVKATLSAAVLLFLASQGSAQSNQRHELWGGGAPGARGTEAKDRPFITVHGPKSPSNRNPAVVLCPGGGYKHLSGIGDYLKLLTSNGITVVHLRYRLPTNGYPHPAPLQDALRAVRMVRAHAKAWKIDGSRVGVLGFSSGGHVASTVATHYDALPPKAQRDTISKQSGRPDFVALFCPVVTMGKHAHRPSVVRLLGKNATKTQLRDLSNELQVTKKTPPTFLAHAKDDRLVKPENSIQFRDAMRRVGGEAKLHLYPTGSHGFTRATDAWKNDLLGWLKTRRIIR